MEKDLLNQGQVPESLEPGVDLKAIEREIETSNGDLIRQRQEESDKAKDEDLYNSNDLGPSDAELDVIENGGVKE